MHGDAARLRTLLASGLEALARERASGCLLDAELRFVAVNDAWDAFADANGGGVACRGASLLGSRYEQHVDGEAPRAKVALELAQALAGEQIGVYSECNSADTRRVLRTHYVPVRAATLDGPAAGVLVFHSTVLSEPIGTVQHEHVLAPDESVFRDRAGLITVCSCCRRVRHAGTPEGWEFVPAFVARPPADVTHGLCPSCVVQYGARDPGAPSSR